MNVKRSQIRKMIVEERRRGHSLHRYSDDQLINEGLIDFLSDVFKSLSGQSEKTGEETQNKAADYLETSSDKNVVQVAKEEGISGVSSIDDLKVKSNAEHRKVYFHAIADLHVKFLDKILTLIDTAKKTKSWVAPKAEEKDNYNKWYSEFKQTGMRVFSVVGYFQGLLDSFAKRGIKLAQIPEVDYKKALENPGNAIKFAMKICEKLKTIWDSGGEESADDVIPRIEKVEAALKELGQLIVKDTKEEMKEWVMLRRLVNAHVMSESHKVIRKL